MKTIWITILLLLLMSHPAMAVIVTENTNFGMVKVIDYNFKTMTNIPNNVFISNYTEPITNVTLGLTTQGLELNYTTIPPNRADGSLYIGDLYISSNTRYRFNMSITNGNDSSNTFPTVFIAFGTLGELMVQRASSTNVGVHLSYYNTSNILKYKSIYIISPYTDFYVDYTANGNVTVTDAKNSSNNVSNKYHDADTYLYDYFSVPVIRIYSYARANNPYQKATFYNFEQSIKKSLISITPNNKSIPMGFDGIRTNATAGMDWINDRGFKGTIWVDELATHLIMANATAATKMNDFINNKNWELGLHNTVQLTPLSPDAANASMDENVLNVTTTYNKKILSWVALNVAENNSHAVYMWNKYNIYWRNTPNAYRAYVDLSNMDNYSISWWKDASSRGVYLPAFTHSASTPIEGYSVSFEQFNDVFTNYTNNGFRIVPFLQWYIENQLTNTSITNVYFSPSTSHFSINTTGYNATTTLYDPNGEGVWFSDGANVITTIDNTNETFLIINTPINKTIDKIMSISVSSGNITVQPITWQTSGSYHRVWIESSQTHDIITYHTIGGLPSNTKIYISINGAYPMIANTNQTGYINFSYVGGFSSVQFDLELASLSANTVIAGNQLISIGSIIFGGLLIACIALIIVARILKKDVDLHYIRIFLAIIIILAMIFMLVGR